jgi:GTP-binding protein
MRQGKKLAVEGAWIRELLQSTNFSDYESRRHFQRQIDAAGLEKALIAFGMKAGDSVLLDGSEFEFDEDAED